MRSPAGGRVGDASDSIQPMYPKIRSVLSAVLCAALVEGCGFALQGAEPLPSAMARTYLETDEPRSEFYVSLRDALRRRGAEIVERPEDAASVLKILEDATGQRVTAVTPRDVPRGHGSDHART